MEANRHRQETFDKAARAWELRLLGHSQQRIAAELGVSQQLVSRLLQKIEQRLFAEFRDRAEAEKALQTARLESIFAQAMAAWARSCEDAEKVTTVSGRSKVFEDGAAVTLPDLRTVSRQGQTGNPALLAQAMKALSDIRDLWGLNSPQRTEISGAAGGPVAIREIVIEQPREALAARVDRIREQLHLDAAAEESPGAE
jgi:hypothetical protein